MYAGNTDFSGASLRTKQQTTQDHTDAEAWSGVISWKIYQTCRCFTYFKPVAAFNRIFKGGCLGLCWGWVDFLLCKCWELLLLRDIAPLLTVWHSCEEVHLLEQHLSNQSTLPRSSQLYSSKLFGQNTLWVFSSKSPFTYGRYGRHKSFYWDDNSSFTGRKRTL